MTLQSVDGLIQGLHHITLVTSNQEANRRFYTEVLGLRRVKLSVNQDDVFHRHLFYADERGTTGSAITFFEWPDLPPGTVGLGSPHHLSYRVGRVDSLPDWVSWLRAAGARVVGPLPRDGRVSIYLRDPDGAVIELTAAHEGTMTEGDVAELGRRASSAPVPPSISSAMRLTAFDHASPIASDPKLSARFFEKLVGLKSAFSIPDPDQRDASILAIGSDARPDFLRYLSSPSAARGGLVGRGSIHHIAMAVEDDRDQLRIMRRLDDVGIENSGVVDRSWFRSLYFRDPDGNLLEVATKGPGYTYDEPLETLGSRLALPRWLEPRRAEIEAVLKKTDDENPAAWPPARYPATQERPEALASAA
jgi:glyoxalase family protein